MINEHTLQVWNPSFSKNVFHLGAYKRKEWIVYGRNIPVCTVLLKAPIPSVALNAPQQKV